jgi:tetratricopeptide (TPR) repeat protein
MKPVITIILVLAIMHVAPLLAQSNQDVDSLLSVYKIAREDTSKIDLLGRLYNYYLYRDRSKARQFALEEVDLSRRLEYTKGEALGNYHMGVIFNNISMPDSATHRYHRAKELAISINDLPLTANINHAMAIQQFYRGNLNEAMTMTEETIDLYTEAKDSVGLAIALDFLGMVHQNKGNYRMALGYVHEGLDIFQKVHDSIRIADAYTHLAAIEANLQNNQTSIDYNLRALEIYEDHQDTYYASQALNDIGQMYLLGEDYTNARSYLEKALQKSIEADAKSITGTVYTNLGKLQIAENQPEGSFTFFDKALEIQTAAGETRKLIITKNQVGHSYNEAKQPRKAIPVLSEVIEIADSIDSKSILRYAYQYRSTSHQLLGNHASALEDFKMYKMLSDTLFNIEKSRQIEELRTIHDLEQKELEIELQDEEIKVLNSTIRVANIRKTAFAMGMIAFIVIAILIYYSFRQRMKKREIARKKQEELLKNEIEYKKKELASQTLHLVQKNTFIRELQDNLERIKSSPELFKIEFRRIVMLLKRENAADKDWEVFKSYFSEVHDNFDKKLMSVYPEISEKELRMAAFIKMNLSTKEIAVMLNVLPESVLKSKYRLKKKLKLGREVDLYQFLLSL